MLFRKKKEKREKQEDDYQIVLADWKQHISNENNNRIRNKFCIQFTSIKSTPLEDELEYIKRHPMGKHWHYPKLIKKNDFHEFYKTNEKNTIGKNMIDLYQASRS